MAEYIVGNVYDQTVRRGSQGKMPWVRMAEVEAEVTKTSRGAAVVVPMSMLDEETDMVDLALGEAPSEVITADDRDVTILLEKLGKKYQVYDGTAELQQTVADRALIGKVYRQARLAANTVDQKACDAVVEIPIDGEPYEHEMGPHAGPEFEPVADEIIYIGTDLSGSLESAEALALTDTMTAAALRLMVQKCVNRGVDPLGYLVAGDLNTVLYGCNMTDKQMEDLRNEVGRDSITATNQYVASDARILTGTFQVFENLILQTSTRAKEVVTPDEGDAFYAHRCVVYGRGYLGLGATMAGEFPESGTVEKIGVFAELDAIDGVTPQSNPNQMPRIFEIRKVPAGDAQGTMSKISWLAVVGFKLLDPARGIQLITRASNDPAIEG